MTGAIYIIGCGGHATSAAEVAVSAGFEILGFVDGRKAGSSHLGFPVIGQLPSDVANPSVFIAIGDNAVRERVAQEFAAEYPAISFPSLCHPSASISTFARLGDGNVIMQNATIGSNTTIGSFCIVNSGASIDHDGHMADYSSLAPGSVTGGNFTLGARSAVGIGAVVMHTVTIEEDVVVGANSYVNKNLPKCTVYYGTPAAFVRDRQRGDKYL